jgi:hypothetical protein
MTNDSKPKKDQSWYCILDALPPEMLRNATDFLDEESVVKFFIAALGSVPHQYIYTSMARRIVQDRFASLQELVSNPLPVVPPAKVPPIVPPAIIEFVGQYVSQIDDGDHGIVQATQCLSGHMAVLHYFRDTIASNTKQDILWPVWFGKLQLNGSDEQEPIAPTSVIATPIWYPSLIRRCKHSFSSEYHASSESHTRAMLHGFDVMRRLERGFNFVLATVTGISAEDCEELRAVSGRRLNRLSSDGAVLSYRMAAFSPVRAQMLLHRHATLRARAEARGAQANRWAVAAADPIENAHLPIAQYQRIVSAKGEGSSQLFIFWDDGQPNVAPALISCQEFTNEVVELLAARKSVQLLSSLPEYWHAGEWAEPPTMMWHRS